MRTEMLKQSSIPRVSAVAASSDKRLNWSNQREVHKSSPSVPPSHPIPFQTRTISGHFMPQRRFCEHQVNSAPAEMRCRKFFVRGQLVDRRCLYRRRLCFQGIHLQRSFSSTNA
uniref:(northern house mosquito) hypothetical protein n=1 Tax=Culex pipiens TaxID=7175 RepID=A0A8D8DB34_CULPI